MIGRFLELSLHAPEILESFDWWRRLGFREVATNDAYRHPYAVVSDGRHLIGLHQRHVEETTLTFVRPDLATNLDRLRATGVEFEFTHLGEEQFHEVGFRSPDGQRVSLLESRTCSMPPFDDQDFSLFGRLSSLDLPARRIERTLPFWAKLGLAVIEFDEDAPTTAVLSDGNSMLRFDEDLDSPQLAYRCEDLDAVVTGVAARVDADIRRVDDAVLMDSPEGITIRIDADVR